MKEVLKCLNFIIGYAGRSMRINYWNRAVCSNQEITDYLLNREAIYADGDTFYFDKLKSSVVRDDVVSYLKSAGEI